MNKKILSLMALLIVAIIGISVFSATTVHTSTASQGIQYAGLQYTGIACIQKISKDGVVIDYGCRHNLITNKGLEMVKTALNGTVGNWELTNLTVGGNTSAMAATDTDLANIFSTNGLSPATATYTRIGTGNSSLNYQWTVTTAQSIVNSTGIYNTTGAGGNLFSEASWTPTTTLQIGDKLNITYYWWVA